MSTQFVSQAVREALGEQAFNDNTMGQVEARAAELRKNKTAEGDDFELQILALREVMGVGLINPNVESQIRSRVRTLNQDPQSPQPGNPQPAKGQVPDNVRPTTGSPNQPQEPATDAEIKQQAGVKQNPEYADKTRDVAMPKGARTRGNPQDVSIKEGVEGDINAQQKAQFERSGGTASNANQGGSGQAGQGGNLSGVTSGNTGAGGPGAGNMANVDTGGPNQAPSTGTGGTNVGAMGGNSGSAGR